MSDHGTDRRRVPGLRLVSYNVHCCRGLDRRVRPERTADVIAALQPDVALLQELEVGTRSADRRHQPVLLAQRLAMDVHFHATLERDGGRYGHAVLSRLPFRVRRSANLPGERAAGIEPRGAIWLDITLGARTLPVMGTHLGLRQEDRREQVEALLGPDWLGHPDCGPGAVLGGDLNVAVREPAYQRLTERLRDTGSATAGGRPQPTWPSPLPFRRLDFVLVGDGLEVVSSRVPRSLTLASTSDHLPLVVDLEPGHANERLKAG